MFNLIAKGPFFAVQKLAPLINRGALGFSLGSTVAKPFLFLRRIRGA